MKVLMTADTVGGVWTYAVDLIRALEPYDVEVVLATMGGPLTESQRKEASRLTNAELCESHYRLLWMPDAWDDVAAAAEWLIDLAARVRPDVVHLNDLGHASLDWTAPMLLVGHSCVLSWWEAVKRQRAPAEWDRYRQVVGAGMQNARLVVAPTQTMLGWFDQNYGPLARTRTIYNGRDRAYYRVGRKQPLVLTAGRLWDEAKNVAILARIASRLEWPVYVAGSAQRPDHCEAHFPGVQMLGPLAPEVLADWYSRAAIYALPARYEPFGLSALEAAFSGCALVLSDIPTLREVWGDAACFVSPDDEEGWVRTIRRLTDNAALRWEYAGRARSRALRYTAGRMAKEYTAAYEELCGGKGAIDPSKLELTGTPQAVLDKAPLGE